MFGVFDNQFPCVLTQVHRSGDFRSQGTLIIIWSTYRALQQREGRGRISESNAKRLKMVSGIGHTMITDNAP